VEKGKAIHQQLNCLRQGGLRASWDLQGEIRVFSSDRSLSRQILFLSTNFLSAQSPFEDGFREVSFYRHSSRSVLTL